MKKMGRPTDAKKDIWIKFRMDHNTNEKLEICMELLNSNKSEAIRKSILALYNRLMEESVK